MSSITSNQESNWADETMKKLEADRVMNANTTSNILDTIDELGKRLSRIEGTLERHSQDIKNITKIVSKNDTTTYDKTTRLQMRATNTEQAITASSHTITDMQTRIQYLERTTNNTREELRAAYGKIRALENSKDNIVKRLDRIDDLATDDHHAIGQVQADIKELQT